MAHLNQLGGLRREYHHLKVLRDGHEDYEPSMVLMTDAAMGRSFVIPLDSMWKYLDPKDNRDMMLWDQNEFDKMAQTVYFRRQITFGAARRQLDEDAAAIVFAEQLNLASGILLCTGFSLFKACTVLGMTVSQQSLVQLMMFIQDGLDDLKAMKPAEAENTVEEGEAIIRIEGKTYHVPVMTSETDIARENNS